jgi:exosortase A-associated hydrolase 1
MNGVHEKPIVIQGTLPTPMLGVLTASATPIRSSGMGVLIVNGGAQYRAGAHRLFVQLARHLAQQGHAVLRFDFPGQGDSPGEPIGFEDTAPHIAAAVNALHQHQPLLQNTAMLGLCDGASASLLYLSQRGDTRITHLILLNPWVRSEAGLARARARHYYLPRLRMPDFWRKLVTGGVCWSALQELLHNMRAMRAPANSSPKRSFQDRMASAWHAFEGHILLMLSDKDLTAQEFCSYVEHSANWHDWKERGELMIKDLNDADHTCSLPLGRNNMIKTLDSWLSTTRSETPK